MFGFGPVDFDADVPSGVKAENASMLQDQNSGERTRMKRCC